VGGCLKTFFQRRSFNTSTASARLSLLHHDNMDARSKALFEWSIANTTSSEDTTTTPKASSTLDPKIIDAILGPDDAALMQESMVAIKDTSLSLDDRLTAFDNLELLVESIDNASNLQVLKLWPPLLSQLSAPEASIRRYAAWVIGTAVQNNPKAQGHLLQYRGVKRLVGSLGDEYNVRTKVIYALGSELSNCPAAVKEFGEVDGWKVLRALLKDVDEGTECQRRIAFFVANYLAEEDVSTEGLQENGYLGAFVRILSKAEVDLREKVPSQEEVMTKRKTIQAVTLMLEKGVMADTEVMEELKETIAVLRHDPSIDQDLVETLQNTIKVL
jgi:hsp70-interacting protein